MDQRGHLKVTSQGYKWVRIYKAPILPFVIYGAESWILRQADTRRLESFEMRCLRVILGVHLMDRVKNEEIRQRLNIPNTICEEVSKRNQFLFYFFIYLFTTHGLDCRMPRHRLPLQAYTNYFIQWRPPGRPPTRWRDRIFEMKLRHFHDTCHTYWERNTEGGKRFKGVGSFCASSTLTRQKTLYTILAHKSIRHSGPNVWNFLPQKCSYIYLANARFF